MTIGIKKVDRNVKLTFWERLYIPEILRGMGITLRHFFYNMAGFFAELAGGRSKRRIMTMYYPEEKPETPPSYRGRPVLVARDEDGVEKCVACGLCEAVCPAHCISIIGAERENGERYPESYILDGSRCIFCGLCEEACPKEAIVMSGEYFDICDYDRSRMVYDKKALLRPESALEKRLEVIRERYFNKDRYE
ncbi:MAG: NuoI/complex I 23 kDa subunit family protein [Candidatus Nitrospinota bacterium M3_3B_026]